MQTRIVQDELAAETSQARAALPLYRNSAAALEHRVVDLLVRLTTKEKAALVAGADNFCTVAIARLGIPAMRFADGPNGVRSTRGDAATAFPTGVALAATWNPELIARAAAAIGREARALGVHVVLGPNVNIQRNPLAGRNFETYSEDPLLSGSVGSAFVRGLQSEGVGASVKHFVANEQERQRRTGSSNVDERTLREIYLLPFETIVRQAHPWTMMSSYNRLNGTFMTENRRLLTHVLKDEWGFDGMVMSDWSAVHTTVEAANAGLDLEMPGPARYYGDMLVRAVRNAQVDIEQLDDNVRRVLRTLFRTGVMDAQRRATGELGSERHRSIAVDVARDSITLLKNENGLLPLSRARVRSLAVIGPNADAAIIQGGGSANVIPWRIVTALESLRDMSGMHVEYAQGVDNELVTPAADSRLLSTTSTRETQGLQFAIYANAKFSGKPASSGVDTYFNKLSLGEGLTAAQEDPISARWVGYFWPPKSGTYEFSLTQVGSATLTIDGTRIIDDETPTRPPAGAELFPIPMRVVQLDLRSGRGYPLQLDYVSSTLPFHLFRFGIRPPAGTIDEAVRIARNADVAVVFVGVSTTSETEGADRRDMELYGAQNELVEAVAAANPRTVVVLNNGAPLRLPWIDRVGAVVEAWLPGQEGARAVAEVLLGTANPCGKLPLTFPRRLEDNPSFLYYSNGRDAHYGEGVFVGYRYYEKKKVEPLFPFGHGLSYTTFEYANLRAPDEVLAGQPIHVSIDVTNTGTLPGRETVQLYVGDEVTQDVVRPVKELKGFHKVELAPGESQIVRFTLSTRDLAYYDVHRRAWTTTPGKYRLYVGSSAADIRATRPLNWIAPVDERAPVEQSTFEDDL
ncbi:MAG TPA: glycoside hydrolase family 3 C-terminal domain-containing protein [Steroidobacteraceae bacterium]|nr:glycoside hydrolase family 3 C-terminal domain-containing protein [Steroidobacteraceae bacterium]